MPDKINFKVNRRWVINTPWSKRPIFVPDASIQVVDFDDERVGEPFVKLLRGSSYTNRLVFGRSPRTKDEFRRTSIFEDLRQLWDNARTLAINKYRTNAQAKADQDAANKLEGKINVAIDLQESTEKAEKKKKKITGMLPNHFVTVQVANQNGADVSITMLTERNINK